MLMTERDSMPVTGFSLKPTEIQPGFCPVNTVDVVWSEALLDAMVEPVLLLPSNGWHHALKASQQETVHPIE